MSNTVNTLVTNSRNNTVPCRILNNSDSDIHLKCGSPIARVSLIESANVTPWGRENDERERFVASSAENDVRNNSLLHNVLSSAERETPLTL